MNDNNLPHENEISVAIIKDGQPVSTSRQTISFPTEPVSISVDDRRQYVARIPIEIDLHITTAEKKGIARSVDVSVTGLLVQSLLELQWEERVIVTILHPEEDTHVCALVARVAETNNPEMGNKYGLRVLSDDAPIWQGVLRRLIL